MSKKKLITGLTLSLLLVSGVASAANFIITGSDNSTNGVGTIDGGAETSIANNAIDGSDTVSLGVALTTTGTSKGIETSGVTNNISVSSSGSITTAGDHAYGIFIDGDSNTTTMLGSITTVERYAYGIVNHGDSNTTTMSGSITTAEPYAHGIYKHGSNNTSTMSGSITTAGGYTHGIFNNGDSNATTMSGSITTAELYAYGIVNNGDSNTATMSGSITTAGDHAYGIVNNGDSNTTTMSGSITTAELYAYGIYNNGSNNTTTMSGSITTAEDYAHSIYNSNDSNTTTMSGMVSAIGAGSSALFNSSGSGNSFTLDAGATVIGDITALTAATNNKLTLNLGQSTSYAYSVGGGGAGTGAGQWTFSDQDGRMPEVTTTGTNCAASGVSVCNLVTAIGSGNAMEQDGLQFETNRSMIGSLELGSIHTSALTEAMPSAHTSNNTWANVYGGTSQRAASTTHSSFDTRNAGLTIGTPVTISDTFNVDLVFNASNANLNIGLTKDQEIRAKSYNIGAVVYDLAPSTGWAVDAFGFIGRNSYDGKRKVMNNDTTTGSETVTASYSGMEVLVGIDAQYSNPINKTLSFIGGMNASLSNERMDAYSESKYFAWDARTMTQATGGITAGLEYHADALTTFASLGAQRSSLQNGKTAGYTNNGTAGSYTDSANGDTYRTASIGFDYAGEGGMSVTGALERLSSSGGVSGNSASLSVKSKF
jgi:hypothetical protein